jgi:hypothetical protein
MLGALGIVLRVQVACFVEAGECIKHCACIGLEINGNALPRSSFFKWGIRDVFSGAVKDIPPI